MKGEKERRAREGKRGKEGGGMRKRERGSDNGRVGKARIKDEEEEREEMARSEKEKEDRSIDER